MKPSQIRAELLAQHAELRVMMAETLAAGEEGGEAARDELRRGVTRLAEAMRAHNLHEEARLRDLVRTVDAWGAAREEIMDESHVAEHMELYAALLGTNAASDSAVAMRGVRAVLERLAEHMAHEEKVLLAEDVLRDDEVAIDSFGG